MWMFVYVTDKERKVSEKRDFSRKGRKPILLSLRTSHIDRETELRASLSLDPMSSASSPEEPVSPSFFLSFSGYLRTTQKSFCLC